MFTEYLSVRHVLSAGETEAQLLTWGGHSSEELTTQCYNIIQEWGK